jgi:hypothetical protein
MSRSRPDEAGLAVAEVRVTLADIDGTRTLRALGLSRSRRYPWLLSFRELRPVDARTLLSSGVVLAERRSAVGPVAVTALLCPCRPDRFPVSWQHDHDEPGHTYRVHGALYGDRNVAAASLTALTRSGPAVLTARQWAFLNACGPRPVDPGGLADLDPVPVTRWPLPWAGLRVAVEYWPVPGGPDVVELTLRTSSADARLMQAVLLAAVPDRGLVTDRTATEIAVEHLSSPRRRDRHR